MVDLRPVAYVIGRILIVLAILMLAPAIIDWRAGLENGIAFLQSAAITGVVGGALTLSTGNALGRALDTRQAYLLTAGIWFLVPFFGALPFWIGAPGLSLLYAYFEGVSGITTTGATVIYGLEDLPAVADDLKSMMTVVLNVENLDRDLARRVLDVISGVAYGLDAGISRVASNTYMILPYNVEFQGGLVDELKSSGILRRDAEF